MPGIPSQPNALSEPLCLSKNPLTLKAQIVALSLSYKTVARTWDRLPQLRHLLHLTLSLYKALALAFIPKPL